MTLPVGQDKPEFVRRRVRKLLVAGVVSALACMVKSENPALTNSCRELISRCGGSWVPGILLVVKGSSWIVEGMSRNLVQPGPTVTIQELQLVTLGP